MVGVVGCYVVVLDVVGVDGDDWVVVVLVEI